ncbi:cellulase family glycosylhydrolase [Williamsia deligens]|uniref:Cellulase family glycosylhydrolase n=1 Tax=Williamsia deligens TaxID=321325 RepID=A0ABW3G116_9NOCA|nr:cellulase family glycosylhydrolase [Williamsia deligens]MCP2194869.1 Cellulase (glycosyl hydrolase family 5) [Williamsia deligens]
MHRARTLKPSALTTRITTALTGLASVAAIVGVAALAPPSAQLAVTPMAAIVDSPDTVGISDNDLYWDANDPAAITDSLDKMQALGVQNIRIAVPWAGIEPVDGNYDWSRVDAMVNAADARGMGILAVVSTSPTWTRAAGSDVYAPPTNPATMADFLRTLSSRYAGKIGAYEVWNEPNYYVAYQPAPDPAGYTALLKAAYPAIKAGDPDAQVIGGVLGSTLTWGNYTMNPVDFVQQMYADGAEGSFDALSFHPYQNTLMFSQGPAMTQESPLGQLTRIRTIMSTNGDASKEIWSSEYGLPTGVVGEQNQASFMNDFLTTWSTLPYAGPSFVYTLQDRNTADTTDPESTFGIYRDDGTGKPVASVIAAFIASHRTSSSTAVARDAALVSKATTTAASTSAATPTASTPTASTPTESTPVTTPSTSSTAPTPDVATPAASTTTTPSTTTEPAVTEPATTDATAADASAAEARTAAATTAAATATAPSATEPATTAPTATTQEATPTASAAP